MNHGQMAQMTYGFVCKASISGADGEAIVECKQWLQAIGSGQLRVEEQQSELDQQNEIARQAALKKIGEDVEKANGEDVSPDGPEGDTAPG